MMGLMPLARALIKLDDAVHRAVVGDGKRGNFSSCARSISLSDGTRHRAANTRCAGAGGQNRRATWDNLASAAKTPSRKVFGKTFLFLVRDRVVEFQDVALLALSSLP